MSQPEDVHATCIRFSRHHPPGALQRDTPERTALVEQIYAALCWFEEAPSAERAAELGAYLTTLILEQPPADRASAFGAVFMGLSGWAHHLLDCQRASGAPLSGDN
jgi:hypothetical protein